jgi:cobalt-zinc-cadmium efflux system membrane fusion protein
MTPNTRLPGRTRAAALAGGAVVVLVALFLWFRPAAPREAAPPAAAAADGIPMSDAAQRQAGITVEPARSITRTDQLQAPAVLALDETKTARLGSAVEGKVVETFAQAGDRVKGDKVLAWLHSPVVHEAWASYRKAVAERRRLQTELIFASQMDERAARLYKDKAVAEQEVQRAHANRVSAEEGVNIANTEVRRAEEELERLGVTNSEDPSGESGEQIPVKAPFAGVVLERLITAGTAVTPGTALFVVIDLSALWALAEIDETSLSLVAAGRPVEVRVSAYPDEAFPGTIAFVGDTINPKTRRVTVRCQVPNATGRLKPEMYATVALGESGPRSIVAVPSQAVHEIEGRTVVFVQAGDRFSRRDVRVGSDVDGQVEIRSGLKAGERVAAAGSFLLKSELLKQTMPEG